MFSFSRKLETSRPVDLDYKGNMILIVTVRRGRLLGGSSPTHLKNMRVRQFASFSKF